MNVFVRPSFLAVGAWLGCMIGGMCALPSAGWGKEVVFVARDVENQQAVWLPWEVVIQRNRDLTEPLLFRLENPTGRTHVFEAPGLFESVEEKGIQTTRPVRITIAPEETEEIVLDRNRMTNDGVAAEGGTMTYRFYCPLHRADNDLGGTIVLKP